jgi:hypothetical protein
VKSSPAKQSTKKESKRERNIIRVLFSQAQSKFFCEKNVRGATNSAFFHFFWLVQEFVVVASV